MPTVLIKVDAAKDLTFINGLVAQQENVLRGPLVAIGNDGSETILSINGMAGKPTANAMITTASVPSSATTIGAGQIFISGTLTSATAYRP